MVRLLHFTSYTHRRLLRHELVGDLRVLAAREKNLMRMMKNSGGKVAVHISRSAKRQEDDNDHGWYKLIKLIYRVPTPPGKTWIFFLKIPRFGRSWKITGPGKSWKLKLKVLESPGKISLKVVHFSSGSNG